MIVIQELFGSDDIENLVEKLNFNFDQIILSNGGNQGPAGITGPIGPVGIQGTRGTQWVEETDPLLSIKENDWKLKTNGDVERYLSSTWVPTGINLIGPTGATGAEGDGTIYISKQNVDFLPDSTDLYEAFNRAQYAYDNGGNDELGKSDFVTLGFGDNTLVLGDYASIFETGLKTFQQIINYPTERNEWPMLLVAQNKPGIIPNYDNGISIGLNSDETLGGLGGVDYNNFTKIRVINNLHDFSITSPSKLRLENVSNIDFIEIDQNKIVIDSAGLDIKGDISIYNKSSISTFSTKIRTNTAYSLNNINQISIFNGTNETSNFGAKTENISLPKSVSGVDDTIGVSTTKDLQFSLLNNSNIEKLFSYYTSTSSDVLMNTNPASKWNSYLGYTITGTSLISRIVIGDSLVFDPSHFSLPDGSLDIKGTIRIRETNGAGVSNAINNKYAVAINQKDGIVKWQNTDLFRDTDKLVDGIFYKKRNIGSAQPDNSNGPGSIKVGEWLYPNRSVSHANTNNPIVTYSTKPKTNTTSPVLALFGLPGQTVGEDTNLFTSNKTKSWESSDLLPFILTKGLVYVDASKGQSGVNGDPNVAGAVSTDGINYTGGAPADTGILQTLSGNGSLTMVSNKPYIVSRTSYKYGWGITQRDNNLSPNLHKKFYLLPGATDTNLFSESEIHNSNINDWLYTGGSNTNNRTISEINDYVFTSNGSVSNLTINTSFTINIRTYQKPIINYPDNILYKAKQGQGYEYYEPWLEVYMQVYKWSINGNNATATCINNMRSGIIKPSSDWHFLFDDSGRVYWQPYQSFPISFSCSNNIGSTSNRATTTGGVNEQLNFKDTDKYSIAFTIKCFTNNTGYTNKIEYILEPGFIDVLFT